MDTRFSESKGRVNTVDRRPVNEREGMKEVGSSTHFNAEVASADVISEEEVASNGGMATDLEQFHEIILRYGKEN